MLNSTQIEKIDASAEAGADFQECEAHKNLRVFFKKNNTIPEWIFIGVKGAYITEEHSDLKLYYMQDISTSAYWFLKLVNFPKAGVGVPELKLGE